MNRNRSTNDTATSAFTLRELVVVIAVLSVLGMTLLTALHQRASWQIKKAQCAANLRQFAVATSLYANENRDRLPEMTGVAWAWDLPNSAADSFLAHGMEKRTFYCPGMSPRYNDNWNYLNPAPSSLWNFSSTFRITGYAIAFTTSSLILSNQNTTILPESPRVNTSTYLPTLPNSERVLLADATISQNAAGTPAAPAPAGSFVFVPGGFALPHFSPHLNGTLPAGGNLAFKDGHVAWRKFANMSQRASSGPGFWW